ncbi:centrosome and spindle pole-associated protein 1-like isoform X2 [Ylistrum balloti]|uniref:centrosome and spindle pole-associated protein 1-like isoform X2 n=1 Tax=Ylistrum balloti TaxID=509963 RepID=UPI002905A57D|nr:centrosome and spindle pole-associated protein 1-like isoform X2 [Ylistrum balloti]
MEPDRRRQYKEDLEKQKREQALIKMKRDYPNKLPLTNISPRRAEATDRKEYQSQIDERKQKQFSKMLAQQPAVRDVRPQNTQPRRRSPSPEFSDPGMQLQADRIRARIRDLPTRPEEVEELQRRQQQQDALKRELDDFSPRNSYEERRPPVDLSPRLDDYGPGFSDRYPPPQEDYRQQPQKQNTGRRLKREKDEGRPITPGGLLNKLGVEQQQRSNKLNDERKKEYNQLLTERGGKPRRPSSEKGTRYTETPPRTQARFEDSGPESFSGGLPGQSAAQNEQDQLNLSFDSPRSWSMEWFERPKDYNDVKPYSRGRGTPRDAPPETRRGWQTPTYDEILEKKRREERQYRRQEDPYGDNRGMRPYASEGAINRIGIDDVKMRDLDRDYEQRRVRFQNDRAKERGILDDDNWLRTDAAKEQEYSKLVKKISGPERKAYLDSKSDSELEENFRYRHRDSEEPQEPPNPRRKDMSRPPGDFFATLPLGQGERDSANKRRKLKYRDELHLQMREKVASKEREKREGLLVSATGHLDPEKKPVRVKPLGPPEVSPRRRIRSPEVKPYHINIVQQRQAPRGGGYDPSGDFGLGGGVSFGAESSAPRGRRRDQGGYEPSAFLDGGGFDTSLLETRKPKGLSLPPGLQYQPTTYITGQDIGGINSQNSIDDAYRFYGMRNPLDPEPSGGGSTTVPPLNLGGEGQGFRGRSSPRVTFDESARRTPRHRSPGRTTPYQFDADQEDRDTKNFNKREYANELARQMELDKLKKERQKQENQLYEKKIEEDMLNYNPFGRSGGGAPNVDSRGQPIADLRQMKRRVDDPSYTPPPRESPRFRAPVSPKDDLIPPPPAQINAEGESTYALGGHGIFGNPRTEEEKSKADKYKDDLRLQILEKKRQDQLKKEQEKIEEEKENRRLEEQRQRIQRDFDEEQRKKREKEEENRRKQEELIRKNEEKRREAERAKREKAEIRQRDRERELDEQKRFESQQRTSSPPVPSLRSKLATVDGEPARPPPEPLQRANSSEVLRELANMRQQLESERKRVEGALNKQKNEPEVFDPRLVQRPPPKEVDVFERATQGNASVPQRVSDNANPKNIQEFQDLKYKGDTESRRAFRSMFPEQPYTNTTLESQQDAMLRQQNEQIRTLKDRSYVPPNDLGMSARQGTGTPRSLLQANTAFIDVENVNHFPEDFDDMPKRNDSARLRRRERVTPLHDLAGPSNVMGSVSSLDVDGLQRKNDARIRRLQQINADEVSMTDPDEILENFMAKQRYNRPPSGQTLQDDTWLQPGNKQL